MHISVVAVYPPPAVGPTARIIAGDLQGDSTMTADIHNGRIEVGALMTGDADMTASVNLDQHFGALMEGDATMAANASNTAYITGDRHTSITVQDTAVPDSRSTAQNYFPNNAYVDGSTLLSGSFSVKWAAGLSGRQVYFDFRPSGFSQIIDEIRWKQDVIGTHGFWKVEAWDGLNWDILNTGVVLGTPATQIISLSNSKPYLVYRLVQLSGTTNNTPWITEVEFRQEQGPAVSTFGVGTAYANPGGQGNRTGSVIPTTTFTLNTGFNLGPIGGLVDNVTGVGPLVQPASGQTGKEFRFDFSAYGKQIIDEITITTAQNHTLNQAKWQGSYDGGASWLDLGTFVDFVGGAGGGDVIYAPMKGNQRGFTLYRIFQEETAIAADPAWMEAKFKIVSALAADMVGDSDMTADISTGTDTGLGGACATTSYENADGKGNRSTTVLVTPSVGLLSAGTGVEFVDGLFTFHAIGFNTGVTNGKIKFDFGNPRVIDRFTWYNPSAASQGNWQWYGSNDNSIFTALGAAFDFHGSSVIGGAGGAVEYNEPNGNTTHYQYYELRQISGTTTAIFPTEFQFHIACPREIHPAALLQGDADMTADVNSASPTTLTIAAGNVTANLTDFPLLVDLAAFDAAFLTRVDVGAGNLRAFDALNNPLFMDVVQAWDGTAGKVFVKVPSILAASATTVTFTTVATGSAQPAVGATGGRNGVWSDYEFCLFGESTSFVDHAGKVTFTVNGTSADITSVANSDPLFPSGKALKFDTGGSVVGGDGILCTLSANLRSFTFSTSAMLTFRNTSDNFAVGSLYNSASVGQRKSMALRGTDATGSMQIWDQVNSWLTPSPTFVPTVNLTRFRGSMTYNGNSGTRKEFWNGPDGTVASAAYASHPIGDKFILGLNEPAGGEPGNLHASFTYVRASVLSDDWLRAEYKMMTAPSTIYTMAGATNALLANASQEILVNLTDYIKVAP
jgi:hypothetical protein